MHNSGINMLILVNQSSVCMYTLAANEVEREVASINTPHDQVLTTPMLRLLSSKAQCCKDIL